MNEQETYELSLVQIDNNKETAKKILKDGKKLKEFLIKIEEKCDELPATLKILKYIPIMISLVSDYAGKRYKEVPYGSIVAIVASLIYVLLPVDLIPDGIGGPVGYLDDTIVITSCLKLIKEDIEKYLTWRDSDLQKD